MWICCFRLAPFFKSLLAEALNDTSHVCGVLMRATILLSRKDRWTCMCDIGAILLMLFSHDTGAVSS